ncbi:MAG: hypothetical protein Q4F81_08600 [Eubacteriales bacterium]|nr:hypothetical protein [Eubacteriales bacterium]
MPQHLLIDLADRCSEGSNGGRCVKIEDCHEILMVKILFRLQPTTGHQGIGDADSGGRAELHRYVKFIVLLQKGIVNDAENVLLVIVPIFICQLSGNTGQLLGKIAVCDTIAALQHGGHWNDMFWLHGPEPRAAGVFPFPGVRDIKDIAQPWPVPGIVHQGNSPGAALHIPAHPVIPKVILRTSGGIRALGIDHQLLMVGIFVKAGGGSKERRPFLPAAGEPGCHLVGHLCIQFCFTRHGFEPPFVPYKEKGRPDSRPFRLFYLLICQSPGTAPVAQRMCHP